MVALFVRLKWALTTARLRSASTGARIGVVIGVLAGLAVSGAVAVGLAMLRSRPDLAVPLIGAVFTAQWAAWVLAPMVAFGVDETLDPRRFALLPLTPAAVQRGLLASAVIGYLPVFNLVLLAGAAVGLSGRPALVPVAVVCCLAQMAMCVVFSRAASTSMVTLLSSRRGRDLGMALGIALMIGYFVVMLLLNNQSATAGDPVRLVHALRPVRYGPPGALAEIPSLVGGLTSGVGGARLVAAAATAAAFLAVGWWWWGRALTHAMTTSPSTTASNTAARTGDLGGAVADSLGGTARLVAARDLRLAWRDPARRLPWVLVLLFTVAWPFLYQGRGGLFAVLLGAIMVGAQTANHYGVEGSGLWLHLVSYADRMRARGEVAGHAVASLIPGAGMVALGLAVQVTVRGHAALLPAAAGVCLAGLLGSVAGACWMSAVLPFAMPQRRTSAFASSVPGQKGRAAGASFSVLGIAIATAVPAAVCAVLAVAVDAWWGAAALLAAAAAGVPVLLIAIRAAARRYLANGPEILAVVSAGDRT